MRNKIAILFLGICFSLLYLQGCNDDIEYGDVPGSASGVIDFSEGDPEVEIDNIIVEAGEEVDYISELEVIGEEELDEYQISVNTTGVVPDQPGSYTATYTITYDGKTYTKQITVTVEGESQTQTQAQTAASSQTTAASEQTSQGSTQSTTSSSAETTLPAHISTDGNGNLTTEVELLSGERIAVTCTSTKYVTSTRTDVSKITRNGTSMKFVN
jgi:hypothetical protein